MKDLRDRAETFFRAYADGIDRRSVGRLFEEDTTRAFTTLAGEVPEGLEQDPGLWAQQAWAFLRGMLLRLSPARRLLFTVALLVPFLSVFDALTFSISPGSTRVTIDFSPVWFVLSIAGLTFLLALELVERMRVRDELEVARQLQRDLLPGDDLEIPGYLLAHSSRTANEIGGDYYDVLTLADGRRVVAVGDASGHGIGAGLLMAICHVTLKTAVAIDPRPSAVLERLNRTLYETGDRRAFMTLFYGLLDPETGVLDYSSAGHPFPFLRRASGEIEELGQGALPLGIRESVEYVEEQTHLDPTEHLVLYSDGLPEAVGGADEDTFGFDRLKASLHTLREPRLAHRRILNEVERHLGSRSLDDDLTLVVLQRIAPLPT